MVERDHAISNLITWEDMPNVLSTSAANMTVSYSPTEVIAFRFLPIKPLGGLYMKRGKKYLDSAKLIDKTVQ